jgi:hypothetical protein
VSVGVLVAAVEVFDDVKVAEGVNVFDGVFEGISEAVGVDVFEGELVGLAETVLVRVGVRVGVRTLVFVGLGVELGFLAREGEEDGCARTEYAPAARIATNRIMIRKNFNLGS